MANILFVGHPTEATQDPLINRLTTNGHTVNLVDDTLLTQADIDASDMVLLGWRLGDEANSRPLVLNSKKPVLISGGVGHGPAAGLSDTDGIVSQTIINVEAGQESHPMLGGILTTNITVFTAADNIGHLRSPFATDLVGVATYEGSTSRFAMAEFPKGSYLLDGVTPCPGPRTYLGFLGYGCDVLTADGFTIFDATINHTLQLGAWEEVTLSDPVNDSTSIGYQMENGPLVTGDIVVHEPKSSPNGYPVVVNTDATFYIDFGEDAFTDQTFQAFVREADGTEGTTATITFQEATATEPAPSADTTPDQFLLGDVVKAALSTSYESDFITVSGVDSATDVPISVKGGAYAISTDNGTTFSQWTTLAGVVQLDYLVKVRGESSSEYETPVNVELDIGGVRDVFTITTIEDPNTVNVYRPGQQLLVNSSGPWDKVSEVVLKDANGRVYPCEHHDKRRVTIPEYVPLGEYQMIIRTLTGAASSVHVRDIVDAGATGKSLVLSATPNEAKINLNLQNVDNTSDVDKPVSTAQQAALDAKVDDTEKGAAGGVATLDANIKIPLAQIPDSLIGNLDYQSTWDASTNTPTLPTTPVNKGEYWVTSVEGTFGGVLYNVGDWIIAGDTSWDRLDGSDAVASVFGRKGDVTAQAGDYDTDLVTEGVSNLYFTDTRALSAVQTELDSKLNRTGDTIEGKFTVLSSGLKVQKVAEPAAPTVTNVGTTGTTTYTYHVVAEDKEGNKTLASAGGSTTTGNATLDATNYNTVSFVWPTAAVKLYVLKGGTGGTVLHSTVTDTSVTSVNDQGQVLSAFTEVTRNTTADVAVDGDVITEGGFLARSGWNITLRASDAAPSDPGDIIFEDGTGAELHRLWAGTGTLNYREARGTPYGLWHGGNLPNPLQVGDYGIGDATLISDLNAHTSGKFVAGGNATGAPYTSSGVFWGETFSSSDSSTRTQLAYDTAGKQWVRYYVSSAWGVWARAIDEKGGDFTGKVNLLEGFDVGANKICEWYAPNGAIQRWYTADDGTSEGTVRIYNRTNAATPANTAFKQEWYDGVGYHKISMNSRGMTVGGNNVITTTGGSMAKDAYLDFGPNTAWGATLRVGGNGYTAAQDLVVASVVVTNGNLHLDSGGDKRVYINYYSGTAGTLFGNGAKGIVAAMGPDGDLWKGGADNSGFKYYHAGDDSGWIAPTLTNGWVNYDTITFNSAAYRKTPDGKVHLKGLIKAGTLGAAAFTLPAGYRPAGRELFDAISNNAQGRVDIAKEGGVVPVSPSSNTWVSLDNISFFPA